MANQPDTPQEWAWDYLRNRLKSVTDKLLELSEDMPNVTTFADLKDGEFFIRFPWARIENGQLVFKNTELYRKIATVRYAKGSNSSYNATKVATGSLREMIDDEPVIKIVVR